MQTPNVKGGQIQELVGKTVMRIIAANPYELVLQFTDGSMASFAGVTGTSVGAVYGHLEVQLSK